MRGKSSHSAGRVYVIARKYDFHISSRSYRVSPLVHKYIDQDHIFNSSLFDCDLALLSVPHTANIDFQ